MYNLFKLGINLEGFFADKINIIHWAQLLKEQIILYCVKCNLT